MKTIRKLLQIVVLLSLVIAVSSSVYSQIIYTDIEDVTPNVSYSLDLNNDLVDDFLLQFQAANTLMCIPQNNNAYAGGFFGGFYLPWALNASSLICYSPISWYDSASPGTMAQGTSIGWWPGKTDKYLGLKIRVGVNTHYGWARLDVAGDAASFTIKDYAYESTPDGCIYAGQIISGIPENTRETGYSISPNPWTSSATLQTTGHFNNTALTIFNSYGQKAGQVYGISGQTAVIQRNDLPAGLYFIRLTEDNRPTVTLKILISD